MLNFKEEWIGRSTRKTRPSSQSRGYFEDSDEEEEETVSGVMSSFL